MEYSHCRKSSLVFGSALCSWTTSFPIQYNCLGVIPDAIHVFIYLFLTDLEKNITFHIFDFDGTFIGFL